MGLLSFFLSFLFAHARSLWKKTCIIIRIECYCSHSNIRSNVQVPEQSQKRGEGIGGRGKRENVYRGPLLSLKTLPASDTFFFVYACCFTAIYHLAQVMRLPTNNQIRQLDVGSSQKSPAEAETERGSVSKRERTKNQEIKRNDKN